MGANKESPESQKLPDSQAADQAKGATHSAKPAAKSTPRSKRANQASSGAATSSRKSATGSGKHSDKAAPQSKRTNQASSGAVEPATSSKTGGSQVSSGSGSQLPKNSTGPQQGAVSGAQGLEAKADGPHGSDGANKQGEGDSQAGNPEAGAGGTGPGGSGPDASGAKDSRSAQLGADLKAGAIRGATDAGVDKAMGGDPNSAKNRYTKAAAAGAAQGAMAGGAHGAAVGAAKGAGQEAIGDTASKVKKGTGLDSADDKKSKNKSSDSDTSGKDSSSDKAGESKLGAGGTSFERGHGEDEHSSKISTTKKAVGAAGVASAAPPAGTVIFLLALMAWLKAMFFKALAVAASFWHALWMGLKAIGSAVWGAITAPFTAAAGFFASVGSAVFGAGSVMATAAAGMTVAVMVTVFSFGGVAGGIAGIIASSHASFSDSIGDVGGRCVVSAGGGGDSSMPVDANTEKQAQIVYSVLSTWGMSDTNIAGILGNWSQESGIDPTSVQNFPVGTYEMTEAKKQAAKTSSNGIGLGQWTSARNTLLRDWAQSKNVDWWTLGAQLAFMREGDNPSDAAVFKDMIANELSSPAAAATHFHDKWERSADTGDMVAKRGKNAEAWYGKMSGWTVDESAADDMTDGLLDGSEDIVNGIFSPNSCNSGGGAGNVSLKDGGLSEEEAQAVMDLYNNGDGAEVLNKAFGGGGPASCGRGSLSGSRTANCTAFSWYFVHKYADWNNGYASNNGIDTAGVMAKLSGKKVTDTPTPYSVGSGPGSGAAGHTFVVLGVEGNKVIIGEAGYCAFEGRVTVKTADELKSAGWEFVDMSDQIKGGDVKV